MAVGDTHLPHPVLVEVARVGCHVPLVKVAHQRRRRGGGRPLAKHPAGGNALQAEVVKAVVDDKGLERAVARLNRFQRLQVQAVPPTQLALVRQERRIGADPLVVHTVGHL